MLLEKSEKKSPSKSRKTKDKEPKKEKEPNEESDAETKEVAEEKDSSCVSVEECKMDETPHEDLLKVVRYLVAAGCDVNAQVR